MPFQQDPSSEYATISLRNLLSILSENKISNYLECHNNTDQKLFILYHSKDIEHFLTSNEKFIFIARSGNSYDAHSHGYSITSMGHFFVGEPDKINKYYPTWGVNKLDEKFFIPVKNTENFLNLLLKFAYKLEFENFVFYFVTGTNGKTSVTQILGQLLQQITRQKTLKIGTLGAEIGSKNLPVSHVTTPDYPSFLKILDYAKNDHVTHVVMETTSHGLKENRLFDCKANVAIFTNLTQDHLDYHGTMEDYLQSKKKLFSHYLHEFGTAIIYLHDNVWEKFVDASKGNSRKLIVIGNEDLWPDVKNKFENDFSQISFLSMTETTFSIHGISGKINYYQSDLKQEQLFFCPLLGHFQKENILCAVAAALSQGLNFKEICLMLQTLKTIPGRLEFESITHENKLKSCVIDYAHSPDALEKTIETCLKILPKEGKLITVFGCGGDRDQSKRPLMGEVAFKNSHIVIVTSDNPRTEDPDKIISDIFGNYKTSSNHIKELDRKAAILLALKQATSHDLILIAGKGHENYQIIGTKKHDFSDLVVLRSFSDKT